MDMLSLCRKRVSDSPETRRRSPRIAQQSHPSKAKKTVNVEMNGGKSFSNNDDSSLPAVSLRPNGSIMLRILAKPGAKQSGITDVADDCVGVQIGAPARESQANAELVNYLASVLRVRKTNVIVEKGLRSRLKLVLINKNGLTVDKVRDLIEQESSKASL